MMNWDRGPVGNLFHNRICLINALRCILNLGISYYARTELRKSLHTWLGEICSCCCLSLLPQLVCNILTTTYNWNVIQNPSVLNWLPESETDRRPPDLIMRTYPMAFPTCETRIRNWSRYVAPSGIRPSFLKGLGNVTKFKVNYFGCLLGYRGLFRCV